MAGARGAALAATATVTRAFDSFARVVERRVSGLSDEGERAAGSVRTYLVLALISAAAFTLRVMAMPGDTGPVVALNAVVFAVFVGCLVAVSTGHQLIAAVTALAISTAAMAYMVGFFGWRSGHHLFLITFSQLVFLVFTDKQRVWRWVFVLASAGTFVACQTIAPALGPYAPSGPVETGRTFTVNAISTATLMFILSFVAHYRAALAQREAAAHAARAEYLANTDPLTGLANRRPILERFDHLDADPHARYCVAVADLDRFKELNDAHGHACGDRVLAALGERMRDHLRLTDALGRWGGEEFIVVLSGTALADARVMMDRLRRLVGDSPFPCGDHDHHVTMSVGVADGVGDGRSHRVVRRADDALYEAKQAGRNCVRVRALAEAADPPTGATERVARPPRS